jgi:hypothetical protein
MISSPDSSSLSDTWLAVVYSSVSKCRHRVHLASTRLQVSKLVLTGIPSSRGPFPSSTSSSTYHWGIFAYHVISELIVRSLHDKPLHEHRPTRELFNELNHDGTYSLAVTLCMTSNRRIGISRDRPCFASTSNVLRAIDLTTYSAFGM